MSLARFWSTVKLLHFSKPAGDRPLYRAVKGRVVESVLEVNVGTGARSRTLISWLRQQGSEGAIRYAAIDTFEMGGAEHVALKDFHSELGKLGVKPLPVPNTGSLAVALKRVAHTIGAVDLVILDCAPVYFTDPAVDAVMNKIVKPTSIVMAQCAEAEGLWPQEVTRWQSTQHRQAA